MTGPGCSDRVASDPIGLITDLVAAVEHQLTREQIQAVAADVAGGRAKSRRLASALAERPAVLADGRSPAPRAVGDLLVALRQAGARTVSPPCCAGCGKRLRAFQRGGQDWYCSARGQSAERCAACGKSRRIYSRDRAGQPRCSSCPEADGRDPVTVIHGIIAELDPGVSRDVVAAAVRRSAPRPSYQQKLAWALEDRPGLLTGEGYLAPLRAIPRFIDALHAADVAGIVRPACPRCHRVVRIDKPLDGVRVCRACIAHSRAEPCARCGARREPVTRDDQGRPVCANCFITDPANLETCIGCGRRRRVERRTPDGPLCSRCRALPLLTCSICGQITPCGISRATGRPWCPACQRRTAACSACGSLLGLRPPDGDRLRLAGRSAVRRLHRASGLGRLPGLQRSRPPEPWPVRSLPDQPAPG